MFQDRAPKLKEVDEKQSSTYKYSYRLSQKILSNKSFYGCKWPQLNMVVVEMDYGDCACPTGKIYQKENDNMSCEGHNRRSTRKTYFRGFCQRKHFMGPNGLDWITIMEMVYLVLGKWIFGLQRFSCLWECIREIMTVRQVKIDRAALRVFLISEMKCVLYSIMRSLDTNNLLTTT